MSIDTPQPAQPDAAAGGRTIDMSIDLPVAPDVVWRALTDAELLSRWFPLRARVAPGAGGSIFLSWGPGCEGEAPITAWEPGRHLQVSEGQGAAGLPMVVDYYLEGRAGATVLRLVHSGFGADSKWDDQYQATEGGWTYFLFNLRHYLTRHPGTPRDMVRDRRQPRRPRAEVWRTLLGAGGAYSPGDGAPSVGERFAFRLGAGEPPLEGTAAIVRPSSGHFAGVVEGLDDALLFVELEGGAEESWHCGLWLSTYGLPPERVRRLQEALTARMDEVTGGEAVRR